MSLEIYLISAFQIFSFQYISYASLRVRLLKLNKEIAVRGLITEGSTFGRGRDKRRPRAVRRTFSTVVPDTL
jgi:hypothetical protein